MSLRYTLVFAADHPVGAGHFPGLPIVPGALLLDRALAGLAQQLGLPAPPAWRLRSAKFPAPVLPGQTVDVQALPGANGGWRLIAQVGAQRVLVAEVLCEPATPAGAERSA